MSAVHEPGEEYAGPAEVGGLPVEVQLKGHLEPIDGRFHWYGRIAPDDTLNGQHRSGATVTLVTPHGSAEGRLSDLDPWGRFRVTGLGTPPF